MPDASASTRRDTNPSRARSARPARGGSRLLALALLVALPAACGGDSQAPKPQAPGAPARTASGTPIGAAGGVESSEAPSGAAAGNAAASPEGAPADDATARRPDIVVYLIDTLRTDRLGLYGCDEPNSPSLDAFGQGAAVFDDAISQGPWTLPSVVSLFTSSFPASHRVVSAKDKVADDVTTMTEYFHDLGYYTMGCTENTLSGTGSHLDQGYDEFRERLPPDRSPKGDDPDFLIDMHRRVADWDGDQPLFLYMHTIEPHDPWEGAALPRKARYHGTPARKAELNALAHEHRGLITQRDLGRLDAAGEARAAELDRLLRAAMPEILELYDGDVLRADLNFQRLVEALRSHPRFRDTIVVVLADHGEELLDHGRWFHGQSLYQELVHVPLVMRIPGVTVAGQRVAEPVRLIDVLPTLADAVGGRPLPDWQGRSLLPLLRGDASAAPAPILSMKLNVDRPIGGDVGDMETALWDGPEKLIVHHDFRTSSLYDLAADPHETQDLAAERAARAAELLLRIQKLLHGLPVLPYASGDKSMSDDKLQALIQMGYIEQRPEKR